MTERDSDEDGDENGEQMLPKNEIFIPFYLVHVSIGVKGLLSSNLRLLSLYARCFRSFVEWEFIGVSRSKSGT